MSMNSLARLWSYVRQLLTPAIYSSRVVLSPNEHILLTSTLAESYEFPYKHQLLTPTLLYLYSHTYECQLFTSYI